MRTQGIIEIDNEIISLINSINYLERAINPKFVSQMHQMAKYIKDLPDFEGKTTYRR